MSNIPSELKFMASNEWVRPEGDGIYTVGISDHAQALLGEVVSLDLPDVGDTINAGDTCASAESVKVLSDIFSPLTGEIIAVNEELESAPGLINADPYGDGWLFQILIKDEEELDDLLDAEAYQSLLEDEDD